VYGALLVALDTVIEEGVPRGAVVRADCTVVARWERALGEAATVVDGLAARWPLVRSGDPALRSLVDAATAVAALAGEAGLGEAIETGRLSTLAALRDALVVAGASGSAG
jgi:hypothetical protein